MWMKRGRDTSGSETTGGSQAGSTPGKRSLTEALKPVQRKTGAIAGTESIDTLAEAQQGVSGPAEKLPYLDLVQASFGHHNVSQVGAHVGGAAAEASDRIGANAYATGSSVAFRESPDLHTAAHEAAHVVQQRGGIQLRGGVGERGDLYEQHADAVADTVVAGKSAAGLLDQITGVAGTTVSGSNVQRVPQKGGGVPSSLPTENPAEPSPETAVGIEAARGGSDTGGSDGGSRGSHADIDGGSDASGGINGAAAGGEHDTTASGGSNDADTEGNSGHDPGLLQRRAVTTSTSDHNAPRKTLKRQARMARPKKSDHYIIHIKAWIPQQHVVDPETPLRKKEWIDQLSKLNPLLIRPRYEFSSRYRGDNHNGYDGSFRALSLVEFDFDGHKITSFNHSGRACASHRDYSEHLRVEINNPIPLAPDIPLPDIANRDGTETKTATGDWSGRRLDSTHFHFAIDSENPLVITKAPAINCGVNGIISSRGLTLRYVTDEFPSYGIRVIKNGSTLRELIIKDVSNVDVTGFDGAANIAKGLTSHSNKGEIDIP